MGEEMKNIDKYTPTKAEHRLIEVLANPENRQKSVTDICQLAEMSREIYYRAFKKPEFVEHVKAISMELLKQKTMPLINIGIKEAEAGSFNHWKILLEMSGAYVPKQNMELTGKGGGPIQMQAVDLSQLSDKELEQLENLQSKIIDV